MLAADAAQWVTAIGVAGGAIVLLAGVIFVCWQLRDSARTGHAQLLADLARRWEEPLMAEARRRYAQTTPQALARLVERSWKNAKEREVLAALPGFYEFLGVLEEHGSLPIGVVNRLWGPEVVAAWPAWRPAVERIRSYAPAGETPYSNFERLDHRVRQRRAREAWGLHASEA